MNHRQNESGRKTDKIVSVRISRCCPRCGNKLYEKLENCSGFISIKCQRCGYIAHMNLALRRSQTN